MPEIVGSAEVGATLRASTGTIADANGLPEDEDGMPDLEKFTWQWVLVDGDDRDRHRRGDVGRLHGGNGDDLGKTIKVKASFTDDAGNSEGPLDQRGDPERGPDTEFDGELPSPARRRSMKEARRGSR